MIMKEHSTFFKTPVLERQQLMQFIVISEVLILFDPEMRLKQVVPVWVWVDLGVIAM